MSQKIKKILIVVGTRPNFIKVTQFKRLAKQFPNLDLKIVHTGQHYDPNMSTLFFQQFRTEPDYYLNADTSSQEAMFSSINDGLTELFKNKFRPDIVMVPGDVYSTLAAAQSSKSNGIKLAHLESGLRSFDMDMPEENNRIETDRLSDFLFVTEPSGMRNIENEKLDGKAFFVGNTMIDTMRYFENEIEASQIRKELKVENDYALVTLHRPSNVDNEEKLNQIFNLLSELSFSSKLIFPLHPRTVKNIDRFGLTEKFNSISNLITCSALGYFEFQHLIKHANYILTDSGGIQEETTFRQIPCLTLRENTERPITVSVGSNQLVSLSEAEKISQIVNRIYQGQLATSKIPELWDGGASLRILEILDKI